MPKRNVGHTDGQNAFVAESLASDACRTASEAVRARQRRRPGDARKVEALHAQLAVGLEDLQRGAAAEVDEAELDAFLDGLAAPAAPRVDHRPD